MSLAIKVMASDGSATLVTNRNWNQNRFPQAAASVVIVGIGKQPKKQTCDQQKSYECNGLRHKGVHHPGTLVVRSSCARGGGVFLGTFFVNTGLKLLPQGVVIDVASDQHKLISRSPVQSVSSIEKRFPARWNDDVVRVSLNQRMPLL